MLGAGACALPKPTRLPARRRTLLVAVKQDALPHLLRGVRAEVVRLHLAPHVVWQGWGTAAGKITGSEGRQGERRLPCGSRGGS